MQTQRHFKRLGAVTGLSVGGIGRVGQAVVGARSRDKHKRCGRRIDDVDELAHIIYGVWSVQDIYL